MLFKLPESVLVVIYTPALEVLLLERADAAGFWQSVTGSKNHLDEPLTSTAAREIHEETGIALQTMPVSLHDWQHCNTYEIYPVWRERYAPEITHNTEHVFSLCIPRSTPITLAPQEHQQYAWMPYQDAAARCFSPSNRAAILRLPDLQTNPEQNITDN